MNEKQLQTFTEAFPEIPKQDVVAVLDVLRDDFKIPEALLRLAVTLCGAFYTRAIAANFHDYEFTEYAFKLGQIYECLPKAVIDSFDADLVHIIGLLDKMVHKD